jgi:hypothetical protein
MKFRQATVRLRARWVRRHPLTLLGSSLLLLTALPAHAQAGGGADPWDNTVNVLKTAFSVRPNRQEPYPQKPSVSDASPILFRYFFLCNEERLCGIHIVRIFP